jgi:glycerol-3-phosphate dehydrogenase subunit B
MRAEVVVVGAGPAGLATAAMLAEAGREVRLIARGNGFTHWGAGAIDVLGRIQGEGNGTGQAVDDPLAAIGRLPETHPYRLAGADALQTGVAWLRGLTGAAGLDLEGDLGANRRQVTGLGMLRATCLLPAPAAGELRGSVAVVGFEGFRDFSAVLCAHGLRRAGVDASAHTVALPPWDHQRNFTAVDLARAFDRPAFRQPVTGSLAQIAADTFVVPAVLGLERGHEPWAEMQQRLGRTIVEAAIPPPSIPGLRLYGAYRARLSELGVRWQFGFPAIGVERDGDRVTAVLSEGASRPVRTTCQELVLATGGVAGRGIVAAADGSLSEQVAGLEVAGFDHRERYLAAEFFGTHPLARAGVQVDGDLRPAAQALANVHCVGGLLGGHDPTGEGSREGVALATAARAAELLAARPVSADTT